MWRGSHVVIQLPLYDGQMMGMGTRLAVSFGLVTCCWFSGACGGDDAAGVDASSVVADATAETPIDAALVDSDAPPPAPDAAVVLADAAMVVPDAMVDMDASSLSDASPVVVDASPLTPDAMVDLDASPLPDASPMVDASLLTPDAMASPDAALPPDAAGVDAAAPDAAGVDAAAPDAAPGTAYQGMVLVGNMGGLQSEALFETVYSTESMFGTALGSVGDCVRYEPFAGPSYSAGTVAVTGTNLSPATLTPSGVAPYVDYQPAVAPPVPLVSAGELLEVSATGATIPAFTGSAVVPEEVAGFSAPSSISLSSPLALSWTGSSADAMWITVYTLNGDASQIASLVCFTDDDGAFTVPAAALALMPTNHVYGLVSMWRVNIDTVTVSGAGADATVGVWASQMLLDGPATLTP